MDLLTVLPVSSVISTISVRHTLSVMDFSTASSEVSTPSIVVPSREMSSITEANCMSSPCPFKVI